MLLVLLVACVAGVVVVLLWLWLWLWLWLLVLVWLSVLVLLLVVVLVSLLLWLLLLLEGCNGSERVGLTCHKPFPHRWPAALDAEAAAAAAADAHAKTTKADPATSVALSPKTATAQIATVRAKINAHMVRAVRTPQRTSLLKHPCPSNFPPVALRVVRHPRPPQTNKPSLACLR